MGQDVQYWIITYIIYKAPFLTRAHSALLLTANTITWSQVLCLNHSALHIPPPPPNYTVHTQYHSFPPPPTPPSPTTWCIHSTIPSPLPPTHLLQLHSTIPPPPHLLQLHGTYTVPYLPPTPQTHLLQIHSTIPPRLVVAEITTPSHFYCFKCLIAKWISQFHADLQIKAPSHFYCFD